MKPPLIETTSFQDFKRERVTRVLYLEITDESMVSSHGITFPPGAYIGVDLLRQPNHQDFVIAYISELRKAIFRQLMIENKKRFLYPLNSSYPAIEMEKRDIICGVICHLSIAY